MNLANWLYQTARVQPDQPAIRFGVDLQSTYAAFAAASAAIGHALQTRHGIEKGDRIALFMKNHPAYLEILYGVLWVGAVVVPINNKLHPQEAIWIIENSAAKLVFTDMGNIFGTMDNCLEIGISSAAYGALFQGGQAPRARRPVDVEDDELAWLFYTSGTTGRPKGFMLSHKNLRMMATTYPLDVDPVFQSDVHLYAAPMSHGAGLYNFQFVRAGACHVIPQSRGFDPADIVDLGRRVGNLVFFAAPTMIKRLIAHSRLAGYDGQGIRSIIYGGGPMYLSDIEDALDIFGPKFIQIYGQGESPMTITVLPRDIVADKTHPNAGARRASVGYAQACVDVRVVDGLMEPLPPGAVGEVVVKGDTVMRGYWHNPQATVESLVDGWLKTGDLGTMDDDGFLTLTDRSKDVIISGGSNIYPREVEEILLQHPDVFEVSVVGAPDAEWGESVVAFVVVRGDISVGPDDLDGWCRSQIASFKRPKRYAFLSELPKNSYGKVLKRELRKQAENFFR